MPELERLTKMGIRYCFELMEINTVPGFTYELENDIDASATMQAAPAWATGTLYYPWFVVKQSGAIYQCTTYHTSGTFADDLAAGKWEYVRDQVPNYSSSSTYVVGDCVLNGTDIVQCKTAITTPETYDPNKWVKIGDTTNGWIPLCTTASPFTGKLDGKGYAIRYLYYTMPSGNDAGGLFYEINNGEIQNLTFYNCCVWWQSGGSLSNGYSGILARRLSNADVVSRTIRNVCVYDSLIYARARGGALIGDCNLTVNYTIKNCYSNAVIVAHATATARYFGGLLGNAQNVGHNEYPNAGLIECAFSGAIYGTGAQDAGGLVGRNTIVIKDCLFNGKFIGQFGTIGGAMSGAVDTNFSITNFLNVGDYSGITSGTKYGVNASLTGTSNCYYVATLGELEQISVRRRTSTALKQTQTYTDWNFNRAWYLPKRQGINNGFPVLKDMLISGGGGVGSAPGLLGSSRLLG